MNHLNHLNDNKKIFFNFMNENYTIFEFSNLFFRDLQYAIMSYFDMKETPIKYNDAEKVAADFIESLVSEGDLTKIDHKSWRINIEIAPLKNATEGVTNE